MKIPGSQRIKFESTIRQFAIILLIYIDQIETFFFEKTIYFNFVGQSSTESSLFENFRYLEDFEQVKRAKNLNKIDFTS